MWFMTERGPLAASAMTAMGCSPIRKGCLAWRTVAREDSPGGHEAEVSQVPTETWTTRPTLSSELSRRLVDAAVAAATAGGLRVTVRPGLALIAGGLPVLADGQVAGAIGIAGG